METAQWSQMMMKPMEEIVTANAYPQPPSERKVRPHKEQALNCPRCNSTNTKFCYYNNYSLSQPRYFCKTCRRYWTEGGSLRNIPVGGGSRKNKRSSSSPSTSSTSSSSSSSIISSSRANISNKLPDLVPSVVLQQNPKNAQETQDLNLGFATPQDLKAITELIQCPSFEGDKELQNPSSNSSSVSTQHQSHFTALEPLNGITATASAGLNSFISIPLASSSGPTTDSYSSGLPLHSLNFSLDGLGSSNCGSFQGVQETTGKLLFPFQGLKLGSDSTVDAEQSSVKNGDSTAGYWNGVIGGGSW